MLLCLEAKGCLTMRVIAAPWLVRDGADHPPAAPILWTSPQKHLLNMDNPAHPAHHFPSGNLLISTVAPCDHSVAVVERSKSAV